MRDEVKSPIYIMVFCAIFPSISIAKSIDLEKTLYIVTHHFPPYSSCDGKTVTKSFIKDVVTAACKEGGLSCLLECFPNRRSKAMLKSGAAHGNYPLGWNEGRSKWLIWSPKLNASEYGFYQNNKTNYSTIEDFFDKTVGVFGPSNTQNSLTVIRDKLLKKTSKTFNISVQPGFSGANMRKLSFGRIDGVFINKEGGRVQLKNLGLNNIHYAFSSKRLNYYIGFSQEKNIGKRKVMVDKMNAAIGAINDKGILNAILKEHDLSPKINELP